LRFRRATSYQPSARIQHPDHKALAPASDPPRQPAGYRL